MKLSENTVREIADWLQCGLECWVHKLRGTMHFLPNTDDPYFDPEMWQDALTDVKGREEEYLIFETMDSSHAYRVMQEFTFELAQSKIRNELEMVLSGPKPFKNFNLCVESSDVREEWFNFKFDAHMDWVKSQVNCYELVS